MKLRNIAIIAHVDHGKTTLVDALFRQSGVYRDNQSQNERAMDSNDLEKERGITILAKCTSVTHGDIKINIVDTPGHADFGGEVERILGMVDGVILLVDSSEGPMPQTRFVTEKALKLGLKPIVVINKIDKADARPTEVLNEIFDLFVALDANHDQLDFPVLYASGRDGWASNDEHVKTDSLEPLFEAVIKYVAEPGLDATKPFAMVATMLESDEYLGRVLTGRIEQGTIKVGDSLNALNKTGKVESFRVTKVLTFNGLDRITVDSASAGEIIALAGIKVATVSDTICHQSVEIPLPAQEIEPPTLSVLIGINTSPLAGKEGKKLTTRVIKDRLWKEAEGNVAIKVGLTDNDNFFEVFGRGELQLGVLIETMRREGFELTICRPKVVLKKDEATGEVMEPFEEVQVDLDEEFSGIVVETLMAKKAVMKDLKMMSGGKQRITFELASRSLIGYQGLFLTQTRGTGLMSRIFIGYRGHIGKLDARARGAYISNGQGKSVGFALFNLQERATMFIGASVDCYEGMIVGENSRDNDLDVNPLKGKQLTNMRASGTDENIKLTTPKIMTLEESIAWINEDECVEVTPKSIRLRKMYLNPIDRKRNFKKQNSDG